MTQPLEPGAAAAGAAGAILVLTTVSSPEQARALARELVEARLAACVNLLPPMESIYRWKGQVHQETEVLLIVKSVQERLPELRAWWQAHHPYEVPELLVFQAVAGGDDYLDWLRRESTEEAPPP